MSTPWHEEQIEAWLPESGTVFVFRWVPDFAPSGGRRTEHPTFSEWLDDMRAAAEGLEGPSPAARQVYDVTHFGVAGHRPMTLRERAEHGAALSQSIEHNKRMLDALAEGWHSGA